ncbi:MAG: histidine kinase/PAS protein [Bacteroidota bacterium]|nr:histidine kinase/PAS protein [Bacteroidota bacterium]
MKKTIHIQSEEARKKTINRFCKLIAASSLPSVLIYLYLNIPVLVAATGIVAILFLFFVYLNQKHHFKISRAAIIVTTNLGLLFFSIYLGYDSGIYLYLFVSPLLIYLLFDFHEKKSIAVFLLMYVFTFILIYTFRDMQLSARLTGNYLKYIYSFNFCSAFILCFGLITHFANNNYKYITDLRNQQITLQQEVRLRNKSEDLLKKSLQEREVLLAEIHHRVKNNLAIISALLNLQKDNLKEEHSKQIFEETRNRIYAMSLIHNLLYENNSFSKIDFGEYVHKFCENISQSYNLSEGIIIEHNIEEIEIDINTAVPLALMLNELLTNAIKHAFVNQKSGKISVGLAKSENKKYKFWVSDSGIGMDESKINSTGMGMDLIHSLVDQVDGSLEYMKNNGSQFTVNLPILN